MCDPITAMAIASAGAQQMAGVSAANATNAMNLQIQKDAGQAAGWQYADLGRKTSFEAKSLNQEGYDLTMKARENMGTGVASAGSSGVQGLTLGSLVSNSLQKTAENNNRIETKRGDALNSFVSNAASIAAGNRSVINSTPMDPGPSLLNLAINAGSAATGTDWGKENIKFN